MSSWQISRLKVGDLTLTILPLGTIREDPSLWVSGGGPDPGIVELPTNCLHVAGPDCSVLIDACDPGQYPATGNRYATIQAALDSAGISAAAISHVILTHGHHDHFCGVWDHANGAPNFPGARHILSSHDWTGTTLTKAAQVADGNAADARPLEQLHRLGLLDLDRSSRPLPTAITFLDAPGETAGHRVVRIESCGEVFLFLADLVHLAEEVASPDLCPIWADAGVLRQSRRRILDAIRSSQAKSLCSHIPEILMPDSWGATNEQPRAQQEKQ